MRGLLIYTVCSLLILTGCQKQSDKLTSVEDVSRWAAQTREQARVAAHIPKPATSTQLFSHDLPDTLNKQTFIANNDSPSKNKTTEQTSYMNALKSLITEVTAPLREPPFEPSIEPAPLRNIKPAAPTLTQATLADIHYQGMLHQNGQTWGVVRVGERLYRVSPQERIGKELWSVTQLTDQKLQLSANGKTHTLTKGQLESIDE
jgi:Tfp pilus assembly protein PilP